MSDIQKSKTENQGTKITKKKSLKTVSHFNLDPGSNSSEPEFQRTKSNKKISFQEIPEVTYIKLSQQELDELECEAINPIKEKIQILDEPKSKEEIHARFQLKRMNSEKNEFPKQLSHHIEDDEEIS